MSYSSQNSNTIPALKIYYNPDTGESISHAEMFRKYGKALSESVLNEKGFYELCSDPDVFYYENHPNDEDNKSFSGLMKEGPIVRNGNKCYRTYYPTRALLATLRYLMSEADMTQTKNGFFHGSTV